MPTQIDTSTAPSSIGPTNGPNQHKVDRCQNGVLWVGYVAGPTTADNVELAYSTDHGNTWTVTAGPTNMAADDFSIFIDLDDFLHIAAHVVRSAGAYSANQMFYVRGTPNAGRTAWTWGTPVAVGTNASIAYPDLVAFRTPGSSPTTWDVCIVASYASTSPANQALYERLRIANDGTVTAANFDGLSGTFTMSALGNAGVLQRHPYPSIDFHHTGDGKTVAGGAPHLFVGWTIGTSGAGKGVRFRKATFASGSWTWGAEREIDPDRYVLDESYWLTCFFDGTRVCLAAYLTGTSAGLFLYERDVADTTTTSRTLLASPAAAERLLYGTATYDSAGNVHIWGRNSDEAAGTYDLVRRVWTRATTTLGAETVVDATTNLPFVSAKRGGYNGRLETVYSDYSFASPYPVMFDALVINTAPTAPTLVAPANAASTNLANAGGTFDWTFADADAGDTQSAWAMRRKVAGAPAYEYWNVGTGAWQSTEVWNPGTTDGYTFAAGLWTNGATYQWSVATKDASGTAGPYASDFTLTVGQPATVTVTAPTGSVTNTSRPTVAWSLSDPEGDPQQTYEVRVESGAYGTTPGAGTAVWSTGELASVAARSHTVGIDLTNGTTYRAFVRVKTAGQYSAWAYSTFTLALTPPAAPTLAVSNDAANGRVALTVTAGHAEASFPSSVATIERSDDGGTTWATVRGADAVALPGTPSATPQTVYDYEATPGVLTRYRAKTVSDL